MPTVTAQFAKTARSVVSRITELLHAQALIVDRQGTIVASSKASQVGLPFKLLEEAAYLLKLPLQVENQFGQVIVSEPTGEEVISRRLAQVLVELVIDQTTVLDRLPNRQALKDQFIDHLLQGKTIDEASVLHQAKLLGLNLMPPRAVILIDAADYILMPDNQLSKPSEEIKLEESSRFALVPSATSKRLSDLKRDEVAGECQRRRAQFIVSSVVNFFHLPDDTICANLGAGKLAVLKASDTKNMGKWAEDKLSEPSTAWANLTALKRASDALLLHLRSDTGTAISIGIGRYYPGIQGLSRSYQDARAALALGRRFIGHNQVYCLDRLGIAAFVCVTNEQTKIELATYLLSPLDCEPELLATLKAFFAQDCCPSATAKQLSVHRNTLAYRLDKITSLTGLNPRHFDDAVQIRLALLLRSLKPIPS